MLRRILVLLDNSVYTDSVIYYSCFVAKQQNAELRAGIFLDIPNIDASIGRISNDKIIWDPGTDKTLVKSVKNTANHLKNKFINICNKMGVKYTFIEECCMPSSRIAAKANFYDLVVTGLKSEFRFDKKEYSSYFLKRILNNSITPVLAVPKFFKPIKNVLIAFDGSNSASRALQRFAHLANLNGQNIKLFMSTSGGDVKEEYIYEARDYLAAYGAKNILLEWTVKPIHVALKDFYNFSPDLIVIGLHSKKFIVDYFIGSVTEQLIERDEIPLFIGI
ncbi:hypothetical protein MNBD_IGNAVI01-2603 [hydrothermal vent metagenome]|uniref:UspA domain-containing protein n=1 Tax=hydrothermal vent metagenome TaxID=652676 RepID=A0A3B1CQR2_9ZZZZ